MTRQSISRHMLRSAHSPRCCRGWFGHSWTPFALFALAGVLSTCAPPEPQAVVSQALAIEDFELPSGFSPLIRQTSGWVGLDDSTGNLVRVDESLHVRRTLLRRGQGPGEFISLGWLGYLADTVVAWDRRQRKIIMVPALGDSVTTVDLRTADRGTEVVGMLDARSLLVSLPASQDQRSPDATRIAVIRMLQNHSADTVATLTQAPNLHVRLRQERGEVSFTIARPFTASDRVAILPGRRVAVVSANPFEFRCCHDDSFATVVPLSRVDVGRVTDWDRAQVVDGLPLLAGLEGDSVWPRQKAPPRNEPPFVGHDGSVWIRLSSDADSASTTFAVVTNQNTSTYVRFSGGGLTLFSVNGAEVIAGRPDDDGNHRMRRFTWQMR